MAISLISILIYLIVIGLALYIVRMLPIDEVIKKIAYVIVLLFLLLWLLSFVSGGPTLRVTF